MRHTLIALLLAGVAGCDSEPVSEFEATRKAAEQGNAEAQFNLGLKYDYGDGVPQDYTEAVKWYRKAADQRYAKAQSNLGYMYNNGIGVPEDDAEALKWVRKAAEQGFAAGQCTLGARYRDGEGVSQDDVEAVKWFRRSAEQGYAAAQLYLGRMYLFGKGVSEDFVEAYAWISVAATNNSGNPFSSGDLVAKGALPKAKAKLTPEQLIAAEKRAAELTEQINAKKAK